MEQVKKYSIIQAALQIANEKFSRQEKTQKNSFYSVLKFNECTRNLGNSLSAEF